MMTPEPHHRPTTETPLQSLPRRPERRTGERRRWDQPFKNEDHDDACPVVPNASWTCRENWHSGYLILLTGGAVDYVGPVVVAEGTRHPSTAATATAARRESRSPRPSSSSTDRDASLSSSTSATAFDEESSLPRVRRHRRQERCPPPPLPRPTDGAPSHHRRRRQERSALLRSVFFCCFPSSSGAMDALHLALPRLSRNKARMQNLVDVLREVRDLDHEEASRGSVAAAVRDRRCDNGRDDDGEAAGAVVRRVVRACVRVFAAVIINKNDDDDDAPPLIHGGKGRKAARGYRRSLLRGSHLKCFGRRRRQTSMTRACAKTPWAKSRSAFAD
ncbi:hypothetical protein ACHAW5_004798 [Stephanodiscus triporus]|uniref:Uncharacterized protein n=1 Tax=Stephanodiscus triporus TaxID=2934178 RepID=A0ABD3MNK8_9STRA